MVIRMNKSSFLKWTHIILFMLGSIILVACIATEISNDNSNIVETTKFIPSNSPKPAKTSTEIPTFVTPVLSDEPTRTPTLNNEQIFAYFQSLYSDDMGCD